MGLLRERSLLVSVARVSRTVMKLVESCDVFRKVSSAFRKKGRPVEPRTGGATMKIRLHRRSRENRCGLTADDLRSVIEYVEDRLESSLLLHELADLVGMNVFNFLRCFRESTGMPPHQYVLRRRVERAKTLLVNHHLSIAEIALRCGFYSQSHLTTVFHRLTLVTPRDFRRTVLEERPSRGGSDHRDRSHDQGSTPGARASPYCE